MYYIVQDNIFREVNYNNLIRTLDKLQLPYEIVSVYPFIDTLKIETTRTDIFPFGGLKLARISKNYCWNPGSMMNDNHDFMVYREYYGDELLNYDSKIIKFGDEFFSKSRFFARPTKDTKSFTGKVYDMQEWWDLKELTTTDGYTNTLLTDDTEVQISTVKNIQQEIRFWIVKGEIVTASQYKLGDNIVLNNYVDPSAYKYCQKMVDLFELNDAFVMDICLVDGKYKIVECNCINCSGFYLGDMQKLLIKLEKTF